MHTTCSDGSLTVPELLTLAERKGLEYISITDHNNTKAYKELAKPEIRRLFSGKIITGIEIGSLADGNLVEILGYGINPDKMQSFLDNNPPARYDEYLPKAICHKCESLGLTLEAKCQCLRPDALMQLIVDQHQDFLKSINEPYPNVNRLYRAGLTNKHSKLYLGFKGMFESAQTVVQWVHQSGGKAFLAHPGKYGANAAEILEAVKNIVDGIECFHYSASPKYRDELVQFCKDNGLLISGGSDFHGTPKPTVELGSATGDLMAPPEHVKWLNDMSQI